MNKIDQFLTEIDYETDQLSISLFFEKHDTSLVTQLLETSTVPGIIKAKVLLSQNQKDFLLPVLTELGYKRTYDYKFSVSSPRSNERDMVYEEMLHYMMEIFSFDINTEQISKYENLVQALISDLIDRYSSINTSRTRGFEIQVDQAKQQLLFSLIPGIRNPEFLEEILDASILLDDEVLDMVKKQLALLHIDNLVVSGKTGAKAFEILQNSSLNRVSVAIPDISEINFDDVLDLLTYDLLNDQKKLIISEINDQVRLEQLYLLDTMKNDRDLIVAKMERPTTVRLIQRYDEHDIIHYISDNEELRHIFYDIDKLDVKAGIAKLLGEKDLAFQVIEHYFDDPKGVRIPRGVVKELLLKLSRKQLAILRMTTPSDYQQLIMQMVEDKRKREDHDNAMFA